VVLRVALAHLSQRMRPELRDNGRDNSRARWMNDPECEKRIFLASPVEWRQ
jgi:hypothetical protein